MNIINFVGGTKGDFLTNYLNEQTLKFENRNTFRSLSIYQIDSIQENTNLLTKFLNFHKEIKFVNTHDVNKIDKNFLKENKINIIHIIAKQKYFPTIFIENVLKNALFDGMTFKIDEHKQVVNFYLNQDENYYKFQEIEECCNTIANIIPLHKSYIGQLDKIRYKCDFNLLKDDVEINNSNRYNYFQKILNSETKNIKNHISQWFFKTNKLIGKDDSIFKYEELYVDKNLEVFKQYDKEFNENKFLDMLEKTWLPHSFNLFGKKINPYDYGYRNYL